MQDIEVITPVVLENAMSYEQYVKTTKSLLAEGKTTNDDNSYSMLAYTRLNIKRSDRLDQKAVISDSLKERLRKVDKEMTWLVLTEGWCGDAAQLLPFIHKMAAESDNIDLKIILRDQNPDIMDRFLTMGKSRSIPKLIALDSDSLEVLGSWGPRPDYIQKEYMRKLNDPNYDNKKAAEELHLWYARDKGKSLQEEFLMKLDEWE